MDGLTAQSRHDRPDAPPPATAEELYARVRRFNKGEPVPTWLKRVDPPDPKTSLIFARDCEVLYHGDIGCSIWPVVGFKRLEEKLFFEAKNLGDGHNIVGGCEFWMNVRS